MDSKDDIKSIREAIERVDREVLLRLAERMALVEQIGEAKLEKAVPFRDQAREDEVLQRIRQAAVEHGLDPHEAERLYRHIMEMSIARQQSHIRSLETTPLRVAYQGVEGSFSHLAAQRHYTDRKGGVLLSGLETFGEVVTAVREGTADVALLPIENTTAGSINESYDLLAEGGVAIIAEVVNHIEHCLLAVPGTRIENLRTIVSHPVALLQCEAFFRTVPWIETRAEFDTAGAARRVKEANSPELGAVAGESAARVFGLEILKHAIQTQSENYTRFLELAREAIPCPPEIPCKTSLLLELAHEPGALGKVLAEFGRLSVNLVKIESRPIPGTPWRYRFYLDIEGHAASAQVTQGLKAIEAFCSSLRVLGTYPRSGEAEFPVKLD